ncbi:TPA: hypothetical protein LU109_003607 [Enterobacter hormaechei subsp. xiangfangensis]|nr:hypothetical protein [Enterobacter hormaechei subsp. xiangfangensis]
MSEIEQTEIAVPTPEDLVAACESLVTGLRLCLKRVSSDDIFSRRMETMIEEVGLIQSDLGAILSQNNAEYNDLCEQAEDLQTANGLLSLRIKELEKELNQAADSAAQIIDSERLAHVRKRTELEDEIRRLQDGAEALQATCRTNAADIRILRNAVDEYREMQPEKLKESNARLKKEKAELTATNKTLQEELNKTRKRYTRLQLDLANSEARSAELEADMDDMRRFDNMVNGEHIVEKLCFVSKENSLVAFFPHIFKWGLNVVEHGDVAHIERRNPSDLMFIQGMDFHIMIRSTIGQEVTCKVCEFGRAIYYLPRDLEKHWNDDIDDAIQEFHMEQLERLSKPLYDRAVWARSISIDELDFVPAKFVEPLRKMRLDNLMYLGSITYEDVSELPGMGPATFDKMRGACIAKLLTYQHESGPISLTIQAEQRKPPLLERIRKGVNKKLAEIRDRYKEE